MPLLFFIYSYIIRLGRDKYDNITNKIRETASFLEKNIQGSIDTAIVLGSGLGELAEEIHDSTIIKYKDIPNFPVSTVPGHAGKMVIGKIGSSNILAMQGRFHFYEGYSLKEITFPVMVFSSIGIKKLILTNAAGGINPNYKPGDLMVIKDHINYTIKNPLIGRNLDQFGPRFPDMSEAYSRRLIEKLKVVYSKNNINFIQCTYSYFTGPSFETPAEIKMLRILGADAVGMSTVPEVIAANHCGMEVCGISCITNMAAGISNSPLSHEEVMITSNSVKDKFKSIIKNFIIEIAC